MALSTTFSSNHDYTLQYLQPEDYIFNFNNNFDSYPEPNFIDPTLFHCPEDETSSYLHLVSSYFSGPYQNMFSLTPEIFPFDELEHCSKRQRNNYQDLSASNMSFSCGQSRETEGKKENGKSLSVQSIAARERRRKITEKTQELSKLIPGGHRMNTAEMLQAAFKYVKFLQAQARLLQLMAAVQDKKKLMRREEVQVLVGSPVVQEKLYSEEKCLVDQQFVESLANDPEIQSKAAVFGGIHQLLQEKHD